MAGGTANEKAVEIVEIDEASRINANWVAPEFDTIILLCIRVMD